MKKTRGGFAYNGRGRFRGNSYNHNHNYSHKPLFTTKSYSRANAIAASETTSGSRNNTRGKGYGPFYDYRFSSSGEIRDSHRENDERMNYKKRDRSIEYNDNNNDNNKRHKTSPRSNKDDDYDDDDDEDNDSSIRGRKGSISSDSDKSPGSSRESSPDGGVFRRRDGDKEFKREDEDDVDVVGNDSEEEQEEERKQKQSHASHLSIASKITATTTNSPSPLLPKTTTTLAPDGAKKQPDAPVWHSLLLYNSNFGKTELLNIVMYNPFMLISTSLYSDYDETKMDRDVYMNVQKKVGLSSFFESKEHLLETMKFVIYHNYMDHKYDNSDDGNKLLKSSSEGSPEDIKREKEHIFKNIHRFIMINLVYDVDSSGYKIILEFIMFKKMDVAAKLIGANVNSLRKELTQCARITRVVTRPELQEIMRNAAISVKNK